MCGKQKEDVNLKKGEKDMDDFNNDDRKFFDKAVLAIIPAIINREFTNESLIDEAFTLAIRMTVQRKTELNNLWEAVDNAQMDEKERIENEIKEYRAKKDAEKTKLTT